MYVVTHGFAARIGVKPAGELVGELAGESVGARGRAGNDKPVVVPAWWHTCAMRHAYGADAIRAAEKPLLDAGVPLMARASRALFQAIVQEVRGRTGHVYGVRVAVLVGPGNNGGDALYAAALAAGTGMHVDVVLTGERVHEGGLAAVRASQARVLTLEPTTANEIVERCARAVVLVDGVLGIGASSAARGAAGELLRVLELRRAAAQDAFPLIIAVDCPSGINCTTGEVTDPARVLPADLTVTFGALKAGLVVPPAAVCAGQVRVVDIGLEPGKPALALVEDTDFAPVGLLHTLVARPDPYAHKYVRGVVGIVAGSREFPGAGVLATRSALACGPGMVRYLGDREVMRTLAAVAPEAVPTEGRSQAHLIGSGVVPTPALRERLMELLRGDGPVVVDAGALSLINDDVAQLLAPRHLLTPHAGELAGLLTALGQPTDRDEVEAAPLTYARIAQRLTGATVVAKGPGTVVAGPARVFVASRGSSRLATAGSGDVLAGIMAAFAALWSANQPQHGVGADQWALVAAAAAHVHATAGTLAAGTADLPIRASNVIDELPHVLGDLSQI